MSLQLRGSWKPSARGHDIPERPRSLRPPAGTARRHGRIDRAPGIATKKQPGNGWWRLGAWTLLLGLGAGLLNPAAAAGDAIRPLAWLRVSEIRAGMEGYGLTVFSGSQPDTFGVKVLGVQRNVRVAGSVILVELAGHELEETYIPRGMSGSPIFLDGRFAGAVAFGWSGGLKPIVGVTPAEEMMALPPEPQPEAWRADQDQMPPPSVLSAWLDPTGCGPKMAADLFGVPAARAGSWPEPGRVSGPVVDPVRSGWLADLPRYAGQAGGWPQPDVLAAGLFGGPNQERPATDALEWRPLPCGFVYRPLGYAAAAVDGGRRELAGEGSARAGAGASASASPAGAALVPGSACAVPLVIGDAQLGAIGTVAWVDADRVIMMGHPVMMQGAVSLPLATAEIFGTFPSRLMSFKMGTMGPVVGTVHHDLRAGLIGTLGSRPDLVPVRVTVGPAGERRQGDSRDEPTAAVTPSQEEPTRHYAFEVVKDPRLTANLVFWCLYSALMVDRDDLSLQTVHFDIQVVWRRDGAQTTETVDLHGAVAGPTGVMGLAPEIIVPLQVLQANRHEAAELREVDVRLWIERPMAVARIAAVDAPDAAYAGQTWPVSVLLQPRRGEARTIHFRLDLPPYLPAGRYRLLVANAQDLFALEAERAAARFTDQSLVATLELIETPRSATELVAILFAPSRGAVVVGREMAALPASVKSLLLEDGSGLVAPTAADIVAQERKETDEVLQQYVVRDLTLLAHPQPIREETRP